MSSTVSTPRPSQKLSRKVDALPNKPGVYLWKDEEGQVLYVGKANKLRQRVRHYFSPSADHSAKQYALLELIRDIDSIVLGSEAEALILENNLIKEHKPRFNIVLRDDKSYPSIAVTLAEPFPRVLVVRQLNIKGARYFGPYTDVTVLRRTLRLVRKIFTVRSCHYALLDDKPERACLDYHIKRCLAPCVGLQGQADYRSMIDDVIAFLEGKTVEVRTKLRQRMEEAAAKLEYERAAEVRNSIKWLEQVERPQSVQVIGKGDADAIGYARDGDDAVGVLLRVRKGRLIAREQRFLANIHEEADADILGAFLVQHYAGLEDRARNLLLPFELANSKELNGIIEGARILIPQRGLNRNLVELADQNARHLMESFRIESFEADERADDPVYALGRDLGLSVVPRSIACIDISTNQGRDTVGSLVWFEAGRSKKSEYRRMKIKGEGQQDDCAAIAEVVQRYVGRRVREERPLPNLLLVDGGKGQLSAAWKTMQALDVNFDLASIAKKEEEIFLPGRSESVRLSRRAPSLRLVQRIRDEAHRFAVEYSRKRRSKRTFDSVLLQVPGIGLARRRALLERFGSLAAIRIASVEEIAEIPGISEHLARRVLEKIVESR